MVEPTAYMISALAFSGVPLIHSIIKETKFTDKNQLIYGGLAAIAFAFVYIFDPKFPSQFEFLKQDTFFVLFLFGAVSLAVGLKVKHNKEKWWTLFLSKRQFGALGISFLWPLFANEMPPKLVDFPYISEILDFGVSLLIIVNVATYILWAIRKHYHLH